MMEKKAGILESIVDKTFKVFNADAFRRIIDKFVQRNYSKGQEMAAQDVLSVGVSFTPIPHTSTLDLLSAQTYTEIEGVMDDLNKAIQQTVREAVLQNESPQEIKKRLKLLLNPTDERIYETPTGRRMNWSDRIDTIARTESTRAQNLAHYQGIKQSGLKTTKYLSIHPDDRLSKICSTLGNKYDKENSIPLDKPFHAVVSGVGDVEAMLPPFHPNCRTRVMYKIEKPE